MYEFPPPIWQNQDWTVSGVVSILIFGLVIPITMAYFTRPTGGWMFVWAVVIAVTSFDLFMLGEYGSTFVPNRYKLSIPWLIVLTGAGTIIRLWWTSPTGRGPLDVAIVSLPLILIFNCLLLPASSTPREVYRRTQCKNNLKSIGLAMHNYSEDFGTLPAASSGSPSVSWRVTLLPYVEQLALAKRYDRMEAWDSAENAPLQNEFISNYACPSRPSRFDGQGRFLTSYVVPTMPDSIFAGPKGIPLSKITDGTSNTLIAFEACGTSIVWTEPRDNDSAGSQLSVNGPGRYKGQSGSLISSWHFGGAQVALADGSVRFMSASTDSKIIKSLLTIDGGEEVDSW